MDVERLLGDRERDSSVSPEHFNQLWLLWPLKQPIKKFPDLEKSRLAEKAQWVLNAPDPPSLWRELMDSAREAVLPRGKRFPYLKDKDGLFKTNDLLAGLTLASLCIPQSIGYATLAKLDPQYGLYSSVIPPLIYAVMGTSRDIAIGPVAVVSLLMSSMVPKLEDPEANPIAYRNLVLTTTFFAGIFQAAFGLFRLGFLVDFLSHAVIVGFVSGAAIVIGLQQMKGLLGIAHFTNKTDVISVIQAIWRSVHHSVLSAMGIIIAAKATTGDRFGHYWKAQRIHSFGRQRFQRPQIVNDNGHLQSEPLGKRNRKLFWLPATAPLISVVLSTLLVYLTRADKHGVVIIKHVKKGLNPGSIHELQFNHPHIGEVAKIGLVVAVIAITEAIAVGRSFASMKGYRINGNQEMVAFGFMNILGSFTSCYVATGSFSRSAVNFSAGCETAMSNIVMAITVIISLELFTRLLFFTPISVLSAIILSALPGLVDLHGAYNIWKIDKLDFLVCIGAFFRGIICIGGDWSSSCGNVAISFVKIIIISIRPGTEVLGRLPGTDIFCDVNQYPMAVKNPKALIIRVQSGLLCFANANFVREKIMKWATEEEENDSKEKRTVQVVILDMSNLMNIDTSGIASLLELQDNLASASHNKP
ncbi:SULFATE TRANSPORTER 2.1 [Salix koriyanagi]|uniref:SULFATE TRANSPORTER 2.1 n=1 Tax=Salix koriyanagi TaxID=2511006 RepID=A0A9Q0P6S2_9ROSI|nr:SULFATE TRANSPORTER 2.1 [Salix koriyanagi]